MGAVNRGDVVLAVSTGGDSPALAAHIRRKLELTFGPEYGVLAERLGRLRREIAHTVPPAARTELWRALATDEVLGWIADGQAEKVEAYIEALLLETTTDHRPPTTDNKEPRTKNQKHRGQRTENRQSKIE